VGGEKTTNLTNQTITNTTVWLKILRGIKETTDGITSLVNSVITNISKALGINLSSDIVWLIANLIIWGSLFLLVRRFVFGKLRIFILVFIFILAASYILQIFGFNLLDYFVKMAGG
jgi:phosphoglycerol transferase MdoB-like AlkP superfamily enzyme